MEVPEHLHEKVLVGSLLSETAGKSSAMIDSFSSWLMLGFGATIAFMLANIDDLANYLPLESFRLCVFLFFATITLGVIQKFLATFVAAGSAGAALGKKAGEQFAAAKVDLDLNIVLAEMAKAIFWPARWFVHRSFEKAKAGDLTVSARTFTKSSQIQGCIALIQAFIVLWALYVVGKSLAF